MAQATFYVQIEPEWSSYRRADGERSLRSIKAERITKQRPNRPLPGTVTVKLTVDIPDGAFYPLRPEAIIRVPEELTQANPIEVTAEQPDGSE